MSRRKKSDRELMIHAGRRRFLADSAAGAMGAAIALASGRKGWYAYAEGRAQQAFMINIHLPGGWDTNWFHCAYPKNRLITAADNPNLVAGLPSALYDSRFPAPTAGQKDPYGRRVDADANNKIQQFFNDRYTERTKTDRLVAHPNAAGHWFGAGAQNAFAGDLSMLSSKSLILKGWNSGGAHLIPNTNIIHGSESQYAISFSGLCAQALAGRQGKRKLHYMQLTNAPGDFGANWAMAKGDQIPINCPDHDAFTKLIQRPAADFNDAAAYDAVNAGVARLGAQLGKERLALSRSKGIYESFVDNFRSAVTIAQLGTSMGGFLAVWADYANYARARLANLHGNAFIDMVSPEIALAYRDKCFNTNMFAPYIANYTRRGETDVMPDNGASNPKSMYPASIDSFAAVLGTPYDATEASLNLRGAPSWNVPAQLRALIAQVAWKFAIAEYLVTEGHTSVVDMAFGTGDHHASNDSELRLLTVYYSLYARLLNRLNSKQAPGTGESFLDRTLVSVFSEFDRTPNLSDDVAEAINARGTGHGTTGSVLFSGYGIKQGRVIGDVINQAGSYAPVPIEYRPGKTQEVNYKYIFPTIMKIMDVEVPANQISDADAILAVVKGY